MHQVPKSGDEYDKPKRKRGKAKSYFGGNITAKQKRAQERALEAIFAKVGATADWATLLVNYRAFVATSGKVREPIFDSAKTDQRLLAALGHGGEAGEVANTVKKLMFRVKVGPRPLPKDWREKLVLELGDDFWYFMLVLISFNISLDEVLYCNMDKLVKRGR